MRGHIQIKYSCMRTTFFVLKIYKALIYIDIYIATPWQVFLPIWCSYQAAGNEPRPRLYYLNSLHQYPLALALLLNRAKLVQELPP